MSLGGCCRKLENPDDAAATENNCGCAPGGCGLMALVWPGPCHPQLLTIPPPSASLLFSVALPCKPKHNKQANKQTIISLYGFYIVLSGYISDYIFFYLDGIVITVPVSAVVRGTIRKRCIHRLSHELITYLQAL